MANVETYHLVEGFSKILKIYGHWPSFHDASIDILLIERLGPTVTIHFRLKDFVSRNGVGEQYVASKVTMEWTEVEDLTISGIDPEENNWIDRLRIVPQDTLYRTELVRMDGTHGFILSHGIAVLAAEPIASPPP